jgi:hypothetical protein
MPAGGRVTTRNAFSIYGINRTIIRHYSRFQGFINKWI